MPTIGDHLHTLGLESGATWKQINESYRDLINVWHPDRFQNNERLRKKAEEQTRAINAAMDELRKSYKEGVPLVDQQTPPPPSRPTAHRTEFSEQNAQYRYQHQRDVRNRAYQFELAPLIVHQTTRATVSKLGFALVTAAVTYLVSQQPLIPAERVTGASILLISALHMAALNAALLVSRQPVVVVSSYGLTSLKTGHLKLRDISRMWSCFETGHPALAVDYSREYLHRQNIFLKCICWLRSSIGRAHCIIRCGALDTHPSVIINRLTVQQLESPSGKPAGRTSASARIIWWGSTLAFCSAAAFCARPLIGLSVTPTDTAIYCSLFLLADIGVITQKLILVKK